MIACMTQMRGKIILQLCTHKMLIIPNKECAWKINFSGKLIPVTMIP